MKTSWPIIALKDIIIQTKNIVEINPLQSYKQITVKLNHKGVILRCEILGKEIKSKQYLAPKNHFIISRIDARNGAMGIIPHELNNSIVTNDFPIFAINDSKLNLKYFNYMTSTEWFVHICKVASEGTTNRVRLNIDKFLKIEIPLPSLEEQKRIIEKIDFIVKKVEEVRALREEAIKEAERLRTSSIDKIPQNLPLELTNKKLHEIADISSGGTPSRSNPLFFNGSIKWVQLSDITKVKKFIMDTKEYLSQEGLKNSSAKLYPPSTVLISMYQKIGEVAITKDYMATNQAIAGISKLDEINEEYLYYFLLSMKGKWIGKGTAQENINQKILENVEVPIPPLPIQKQIVSYLDSLQDKIDELKKLQIESEKEIEQLIPSILDKAFKGEL